MLEGSVTHPGDRYFVAVGLPPVAKTPITDCRQGQAVIATLWKR